MKDGWVKLPLDVAAPWLRLGFVPRALGAELFRVWQENVIDGVTLESVEDVIVRMAAPDPRERKSLRSAIRALIEAGLIVAVEGGVRLLYGRSSYADHQRKVHARSTDGARKLDASSTHGAQTVPDKPSESLIGTGSALKKEREKDREIERDARAHDEPSDKFEQTRATVRREFAQRFERAEGSMWTRATDPAVDTFVAWLLSVPGELDANRTKTLDAFFADAWVRSEHFPVQHLAKYPQRYHEPRERPQAGSQAPTPQSLRERAREALSRGAIDEVKRLTAQANELEAGQGGKYARR